MGRPEQGGPGHGCLQRAWVMDRSSWHVVCCCGPGMWPLWALVSGSFQAHSPLFLLVRPLPCSLQADRVGGGPWGLFAVYTSLRGQEKEPVTVTQHLLGPTLPVFSFT